jgi:hypothetical protein
VKLAQAVEKFTLAKEKLSHFEVERTSFEAEISTLKTQNWDLKLKFRILELENELRRLLHLSTGSLGLNSENF